MLDDPNFLLVFYAIKNYGEKNKTKNNVNQFDQKLSISSLL